MHWLDIDKKLFLFWQRWHWQLWQHESNMCKCKLWWWKIRVCCCLFDYCVFTTSTKKIFTLFEGTHTDCNGLTTVTLGNKNKIVKVCYNCVYDALLIRKLDENSVNRVLNSTCQTYYAYLSYIHGMNKTAKNCLGTMKSYLIKINVTLNRNFIMTSRCVPCLRKLGFYILHDEFCHIVWVSTTFMSKICFYPILLSFFCLGIIVFVAT